MKKTVLLLIGFACYMLQYNSVNAQFNKLLIGDNNNHQIVKSNLNGTGLDTINLGGLQQSFYDADVDPINKKFYMAYYYGIHSMNYDGSNFDTIVYYPAGGYSSGIAVDYINGFIYWGDTHAGTIYRANLDGSNQVVFKTGLGYLADVDLDLINGKLYFSQTIFSSKGLYKIDLNGTNLTSVVLNYEVDNFCLDTKHNVIYFANGTTCRKMNYDGTHDSLLFGFQPGGFFVDTTTFLLYTANITNNNILVSNLNGSNPQNLFASSILNAPFGPLLYTEMNNGIENIVNNNKLLIYPNPSSNTLFFSNIENRTTIFIYDEFGKQVIKKKVDSDNILDISKLKSGIYILISENEKGRTFNKILITK